MSALIGHAKAARILGNAICSNARLDDIRPLLGENGATLLMVLGQAYLSAAVDMEHAMREEATGGDKP